MLVVLLAGEFRSAGELAKSAGITPQAASTQLAQLVDNNLVVVRQQGRHKYFALADADVAHALEALSMVAERDNVSARWEKLNYKPLKCARRCYGHMAGELGVAQFQMLMQRKYLCATENGHQLTEAGQKWVAELGMTLQVKNTTRFAYPCMDWSERRDHLAGSFAKALLAHYVESDWLRIEKDSRALTVTLRGQRELLPLFALPNAKS